MVPVPSSFSRLTLEGSSPKNGVMSLIKATNYLRNEKQFVSRGR